jgi:poly-gamma-glutamate synthase PgsB/CapB
MGLFVTAAVCAVLVASVYGTMAHRHRRRLVQIPIRVHVAGTRGKTTVTRLIWSALREAGYNVVAKTTGTIPMMLHADGTERQWPRLGPANISEQWRFIRLAQKSGAQAVVLECMAVTPEFVWASERFAIQATTTVITNARADHGEIVGDGEQSVAQALRLVVPRSGSLVVSREALLPPILEQAHHLGLAISVVETDDLVPEDFNRKLALEVCRQIGIDQTVAEAGFDKCGRDIGGFRVDELEVLGAKLRFLNAFACNDVQSFLMLWQRHKDDRAARRAVLLNGRDDRPERTGEFLQALRQLPEPLLVFVTTRATQRLAHATGFTEKEVRCLKAKAPADVLCEIADQVGHKAEVWGIGNFHGLGERLIRHIHQDVAPC